MAYYFDQETGESVWEMPDEVLQALATHCHPDAIPPPPAEAGPTPPPGMYPVFESSPNNSDERETTGEDMPAVANAVLVAPAGAPVVWRSGRQEVEIGPYGVPAPPHRLSPN